MNEEEAAEAWPVLYALAQSFFDEDWPDDFGTPANVLDAFLAGHPTCGEQLAREIQEVLTMHGEEDLQAFFDVISLNVAPTADLCTYRVWLTELGRRAAGRGGGRPLPGKNGGLQAAVDTSSWIGLESLGRNYFREDWLEEIGLTSYVVQAFMAAEPDLAARLPAEIDEVLRKFDEAQLSDVLQSLGIDYDPTESLNTNRGWLIEVSKRVQRPLDEEV